jgi:type VI secretion system secreted protein VgrG
MTSPFSQSARMGRLTTTLGPDALVLMRFEGTERMSDLFDWQVSCLAATPDIDFDALIGTHASVTLENRRNQRHFGGIVTEARWLGVGENGHRYVLRLRPWFFLASLRHNQRIFHNRTVIQILEELLADYADAGRLVVETTADYPELEYTVQFRESDMDFATRLMERHGISYHFRHESSAHAMVLTDMADAHASIGRRDYQPAEGHYQEDEEHFWDWRPARRITTGAIRLTDYNFKRPNARMEVDRVGDAAHAQGQIESFDWPGDFLDQDRGKVVAALRTDAERGQDRRFEAEGDVLSLSAGGRMTLTGTPVPGSGSDYLCLVATHFYVSDNYGSGGTQGDDFSYRGRYVLMPDTAPMYPERKTPLADVRGPQTAVVVGEGEIDCDEYGRILVRFHWDLEGGHSMRCRVSQSWAGNGWGGMVIPRIGMEVLVEFLDGDPDQPLVTGCVYNGRNNTPYPLPAGKTRSTFKTRTHKGSRFNEMRFEDERGREEIFVHAQKDMNTEIENDRTEYVGANSAVHIEGRSFEETRHHRHQRVGMSLYSEVRLDRYDLIGGLPYVSKLHAEVDERAESIWKRFSKLPRILGVGNWISHVTGYRLSSTVMDDVEQVNGSKSISTGSQLNLTANGSASLSAPENITVDADGSAVIKSGDSAIVPRQDGRIMISGAKLFVSTRQVDIEADDHVRVKSSRINLNWGQAA